MARSRVVVVGGGIAGLAAALALRDTLGDRAEITVVEGAHRLGGKLRTGAIGGMTVETGAETFLARAADDPAGGPSEAVTLAERVGLGGALRHPATTAAAVLLGGALRPMPGGTLMGVPVDPDPDKDHDEGRPVLAAGVDVSVGSLVRRRAGDAPVDDLVDPLLGGVYAGRADDLSLAVTMPGLAAACRTDHTLGAAVRATLANRAPASAGPAFATVEGGLSRLVGAVVDAMPATKVVTGRPVRELRRNGAGWRLVHGSTHDPEVVDADAVILAVPSHPAARLLGEVDADAATGVGALDYASIALVTALLPAGALDGTALDGRSGALIPAVAGHPVKAITVFSTKWGPIPGGRVLLRASLGRYGDEQILQHDDAELAALAMADLWEIVGSAGPPPIELLVQRWGGGLPQYAPGHLDRIARARAALPPTLALAGAACDGVGIPACIRSGRRAAAQIIGALT